MSLGIFNHCGCYMCTLIYQLACHPDMILWKQNTVGLLPLSLVSVHLKYIEVIITYSELTSYSFSIQYYVLGHFLFIKHSDGYCFEQNAIFDLKDKGFLTFLLLQSPNIHWKLLYPWLIIVLQIRHVSEFMTQVGLVDNWRLGFKS